jgi:hypothetical protein
MNLITDDNSNKNICQKELITLLNNFQSDLKESGLKIESEPNVIMILIFLMSEKEKERLIKKAALQRIYRENNLEKEKSRQLKYCSENRDRLSQYKKEYSIKNREKINAKAREKSWDYHNKHRVRKNAYNRNRLNNNLQARLKSNLRSRISNMMNGNTKSGSAVKDLGCSISKLEKYLESKFTEGMTWENYGRHYAKYPNERPTRVKSWHIDHIIPLSSFDLTNKEQFLQACHYTNLQPLWAEDNIRKSNKILN